MGVQTKTNQTHLHLSLGTFAGSLLLLAATGAVLAPTRAHADDTVNYGDTLRYYESILLGARPAPRPRPATRLGFIRLERRAKGRTAPGTVIVTAPRPREGDGRALAFPNAEATGAAQGQTVNRAINDLN